MRPPTNPLYVKRMYRYVIKRYIPMLAVTFLVCWFAVLMQFLWQYVDDVVGKGMNLWLTLQLIFFAALHVLDLSVPLGILLASLMTFGRMGEDLELLSMKSAGVPLWRIMKPLMGLSVLIGILLFFYLNNGRKYASVKVYQIIYSARYMQPELDIPEGQFFNGIQGYSLYVARKDHKTGLLRDMMIYDNSAGFDNARIVKADSGRLKMDESHSFLTLTLYSGQSFQNLRDQSLTPGKGFQSDGNTPLPYIKETFKEKFIVIPFDAKFALSDDQYLRDQFVGKTLTELQAYSDSVKVVTDSIGRAQGASFLEAVSKYIRPDALKSEAEQERIARLKEQIAQEPSGAAPTSQVQAEAVPMEELIEELQDKTQAAEATPNGAEGAAEEGASAAESGEETGVAPPQDSLNRAAESAESVPPQSQNATQAPSDAAPQTAAPPAQQGKLPSKQEPAPDRLQPLPLEELLERTPAQMQSNACQEAVTNLRNISQMGTALYQVYHTGQADYIVNAQEKHRRITYPLACILFFLVGAPLGAIIRKGGIGMPVVAAVFIFIYYYVTETFGMRAVNAGTLQPWQGMWLSSAAILPLGVYLTIQASVDSASLNTEAMGQWLRSLFRPSRKREVRYKEFIFDPLSKPQALQIIATLLQKTEAFASRPYLTAPLSGKQALQPAVWQDVLSLNSGLNNLSHEIDSALTRLLDYPEPALTARLQEEIPVWPTGVGVFIPQKPRYALILLLCVPISLPLLWHLYRQRGKLKQLAARTVQALQEAQTQIL